MGDRAAGKKLIGAQATAELRAAVDEWLRRNRGKSVTDFVLEACMEKLDREKISYDRATAVFDGRHRQPDSGHYPPHRSQSIQMNENSDSKVIATVATQAAKQAVQKMGTGRPLPIPKFRDKKTVSAK